MQSQEQIRLKYCNKCINKKVDDRFGTLCGLTGQKPNFKYTCKDFNKRIETATFQSYSEPKRPPPFQANNRKNNKSKSTFWIGGSIFFTIVVIVLKIVRTVSNLDINNSSTSQYEYDYLKELEKTRQKRDKIATINYLSSNTSKAEFVRKMKNDTVIALNPKVQLMLPKGFTLSIYSEDNELPIKATSRGYYFICNKITKDKKQDQLQQWKSFRSQLIDNYPGSRLVVRKPLTINTTTNDIDRIDFEIKNSVQTILETARIVDYNNERYFFQLESDASNANHTITNKYLRYYVKMK